MDDLDLTEYSAEFEDVVDADSLADLTAHLLNRVRGLQDSSAVYVREELLLLQQLAQEGSGVKPIDED